MVEWITRLIRARVALVEGTAWIKRLFTDWQTKT
jgi:hypothetical protein